MAYRAEKHSIIMLGVLTIVVVIIDDLLPSTKAMYAVSVESTILRAMTAASIYLGSVICLPKLFGWQPKTAAIVAMGFIVTMFFSARYLVSTIIDAIV